MSIWHRIDALTGVDPNVDLKKTVDSRVAFTYSVILAVMAWLNAAMLHLSGDGRPGMVWIGMIAGTVALACGALGVWTKRPHLTMALILVFAVALYTPSAWGNRGFLPPSAIYLPGILLGFYLVWGARSLFVLGPLILGFLAYIYFLGDQYPAEGEWPLTALIVALAFACIWVSFIGSIFRSASQQAAAEMTRVNTELATALDAANAGSRAKTDFLANMGHEVRTPLNGVLGMTNVLLNDGVISDLQRERLTLIEESGKALHEMLNDILDLSKIEAGRLELETTEFDLPALVHSISGLWAAPAEAKGLRFDVSLDAISETRLCGDPARLRQILNNLIGNAVKFTSSGTIEVEVFQEEAMPDGRVETRFRVRDTGPGIPADKHEAIFEAFSQVDTSTTRRYGGTGLGLAVCRKLAEKMGSHIRLESRPGEGALFELRLCLPIAKPAENAAAIEPVTKITVDHPVRILVVDDVLTNQLVLEALVEQNFEADPRVIERAASGREAINAVAANGYDLVLMDIQMPEMDGVTAMRCIRQVAAARSTRVVAVTALASAESQRQLIENGFCDFLPKPVTADALRMMLGRIFDPAP